MVRLAAPAILEFSGWAHEFQVEGVAVRELYFDGGGKASLIQTNLFLVAVRDGQWLVSATASDGSYRLEQARDLDCLRMGWTRQITEAPDHQDGRKGNVGFVRLTELPHVPGDPWGPILWLAYCSGAHLQAATNGMLEPVWLMDNDRLHDQGFRLWAHWRPLPGVLGLPEAVDYVADGIYRGYDSVKHQPREFRLPAPFDQGYTAAVYRAEAFTNCGNLRLPSQFIFRVHATPLAPAADPHACRGVVRGHILQVSPHCSISAFRPRYSGWATIHDYRWGKKLPPEVLPRGFVSYNVTNGVWPEGQELDELAYQRLRHMAAQQQALRRTEEARRSFSPKLVTAILLLVVCSPIAVLAVRVWQNRGQTSRSREESINT